MEQMGLFEAMFSQRQITRFKPDPVPREAIEKIIEAAIKAPSGGNTQPWHFAAITDPGLISRIGEIYKELWLGARRSQAEPGEPTVYRPARYLANHMPEVPAMILICADHSANYTPGQPIERGPPRLFHKAGGSEPFPGRPGTGSGYPANHHSYSPRAGN